MDKKQQEAERAKKQQAEQRAIEAVLRQQMALSQSLYALQPGGGLLGGIAPSQLSQLASYSYGASLSSMYGVGSPIPNPRVVRDADERIEGWRLFSIDGRELRGSHGHTWHSASFVATCEMGRPVADCLTNNDGHACGIYSYARLPQLGASNISYTTGQREPLGVAARCVSWGVVEKCEQGYRAEFCRIEELFIVAGVKIPGDLGTDPDLTEALAVACEERYACPVTITTGEELDETNKRKDAEKWHRLAHMSRRYASPNPHENPGELSESLRNEVNRLLPESL